MKLIDVVDEVMTLADGAPYAVVGGLAQILWARRTHTDDPGVVLTAADLSQAHGRVTALRAPGWNGGDPRDRRGGA